MSNSPLISVIIPTCHRNEDLARCLERLGPGRQDEMELVSAVDVHVGDQESGADKLTLMKDQRVNEMHDGESAENDSAPISHDQEPAIRNGVRLQRNTYEVIVSDDGWDSTAETMMREHFPWARWIAGPKRGPAANRNRGAAEAQGEWLAFTDDDCVPDTTWLAAYARATEQRMQLRVFDGRVYSDPVIPFDMAAPLNEGGNLWTCNLFIERQLFREMVGFSEVFPYPSMEDVEFRTRLDKHNIVFGFAQGASIYHPPRRMGSWYQHYVRSAKSTLKFIELHPEQAYRFTIGRSARSFARWNYNRFVAAFFAAPFTAFRVVPEIIGGQLTYLLILARRDLHSFAL